MRTLSHGEYTVGWICALPIEGATAVAMLDERHGALPQLIGLSLGMAILLPAVSYGTRHDKPRRGTIP